jgi:ubiquinone/menaquinone biosynthesis C-methylase UbiE
MLLEKLQSIKPQKVLDIGCGCGEFTKEISHYCSHITAIDTSKPLIERCKKVNNMPNTEYLCMDGTNTGFRDKSFDCVYERASLHHMTNWHKAIDEMLRLSNKYVLITEPLDDDRSIEKRNLNEAQDLFLELQHDTGFEHYNHLKKEALLEYFNSHGLKYECIIDKFDDIIEFDQYFSQYEHFADKTSKKDFWMNRLHEFSVKLNGGKLCANDVINIYCEV